MINICFSECTAENLRGAKYILNAKGVCSDIADNLIVLNARLDQGNISDNGVGAVRLNYLRDIHKDYIYGDDDENAKYDGGYKRFINSLEKVKCGIATSEEFRIWYSEDNNEYCSFCFLLSMFEELGAKNKIMVVKTPSVMMQSNRKYERFLTTGAFWPEDLILCMSNQLVISKAFKTFHVKEWKRALKEDTNLRVVIRGSIISVNDDFYDSAIAMEANKYTGVFSEAVIVGNCMAKFGLDDIFVGKRVEYMIEKGIFEVVKKPTITTQFYCKKIKKT